MERKDEIMKNNYTKLGEIIKNGREKKRFTRKKLAEVVEISTAELKGIEKGEMQYLNMITIIKLCKTLEIDLINLLKEADIYEQEYKLYYVIVKNKSINVFKVKAEDEIKAVESVLSQITKNELIEEEIDENTSVFVTSDEKVLRETLKDFYEKSNEELFKKYNATEQIFKDYNNKDSDEFEEFEEEMDEEIDEDYDEETDDFYNDFEAKECCKNCKYYCDICNECTRWE